jgi:selenide,water dikinase
MQARGAAVLRDLVLVGGGHAHVQVLRRLMMQPRADVRVTVVLDRPEAVYSGMVPGFVAGDYRAHELVIDVVPLARRAGARVVLAPAASIDPRSARVELDGRPSIPYDLASLDVGSTVRGLDLPGVREHALVTRPIGRFVTEVDARLARWRDAGGAVRLAVVGGGAAGVELAFTLESRLRKSGQPVDVALICASEELLPGGSPRAVRALRAAALQRGIAVRAGVRVERVTADGLETSDGSIAATAVVWATGAASTPLARASGLPCDDAGFVRVEDTLQVVGAPDVFAVGDCARLDAHPWVPRAGVYAVRQGPVLSDNLGARLDGRKLRDYTPQRDFLALLHLGDDEALAMKWGGAIRGRAARRLKDRIDRGFMRRFQVLDSEARPARDFPSAEAMGMGAEPMACGGCAAKLDARALERALARLPAPNPDPQVVLGMETPDDAAAIRLDSGAIELQTIDAFRPFLDDPYLIGRVAAVNATSDVHAKGGEARHALALVTLPEANARDAEETLEQVLRGIRDALDPMGASLLGGHTTIGGELFVGLSVRGESPDPPLALAAARPGDALVLTKALGTGVLLAADMQGRCRGVWLETALRSMLRANADAAAIARRLHASAATDVTGFGLLGHLCELLGAAGLDAELDADALPRLPGASELLAQGLRSTADPANAASFAARVDGAGPELLALLCDPQTAGGLLIAFSGDDAPAAVAALRRAGDVAACVVGNLRRAEGSGGRVAISGGSGAGALESAAVRAKERGRG